MRSLTELFCLIADFCQSFESAGETPAGAGPEDAPALTSLSLSDLMALAVLLHQLRYRQFKSFTFSYAIWFLRPNFLGCT